MKKIAILFYVSLVLILVLVVYAAGWSVGRRTQTAEHYDNKTIVLTDTIYRDSPTLTDVRVVEIPSVVDTIAIISEYYKSKVYCDTITANEYVTIVVHDTVSLNSLSGQQLQIYTHLPEIVKKNSLSISAETGYNDASLMLDYGYNRFNVFAGYNFALKTPVVGIRFKLLAW